MAGILIALLSGALMSIQGVFNTEVTKQSSIWVAAGWVQLSALAVCLAAWLVTGRESIGALWKMDNKYALLGGVIGAFITITVIKGMDALGPARATMLIVIAQLAVSYLVELLGWFGVERQPLELRKLLGLGVAVAGVILFKWE
ncbi:MAG TPA: DMT family transporter [Candidatus Scatomonas pullistercoris]|uniref:DMT family transporter n=1 Tax=Candidatus Scatomonas pullistercoris TaxID=2840920 RepID=A0A9D1TAJ9_9FIRM|nr:DMT family transporter [Candidatus Scatomonas pullistercoris]